MSAEGMNLLAQSLSNLLPAEGNRHAPYARRDNKLACSRFKTFIGRGCYKRQEDEGSYNFRDQTSVPIHDAPFYKSLSMRMLPSASISKVDLPCSWDVAIFKDAIAPLIILSRTPSVGL